MTQDDGLEVVLSCQQKIIEGESQKKIAEALQPILLQLLRGSGLPADFDVQSFVDDVCDRVIADLRRTNAALRLYRELDENSSFQ